MRVDRSARSFEALRVHQVDGLGESRHLVIDAACERIELPELQPVIAQQRTKLRAIGREPLNGRVIRLEIPLIRSQEIATLPRLRIRDVLQHGLRGFDGAMRVSHASAGAPGTLDAAERQESDEEGDERETANRSHALSW